jgi:hypothetical protein
VTVTISRTTTTLLEELRGCLARWQPDEFMRVARAYDVEFEFVAGTHFISSSDHAPGPLEETVEELQTSTETRGLL